MLIIMFVPEHRHKIKNKEHDLVLKKLITIILEELKDHECIIQVWLFGSFSRNEQTPESDVDVLVRFRNNEPVALFKHILDLSVSLEYKLKRKVDVIAVRCLPKDVRFTRTVWQDVIPIPFENGETQREIISHLDCSICKIFKN
jgi:predicted nucleotidyltransferase